jgi:hypothetical protein
LAEALTAPLAIAALVLCAAGGAKLRSPVTAARALSAPATLIRGFSVYELVLGAATLVTGAAALAVLLALTYLGLAALTLVTLVLARRSQACGCFGEGDAPASPVHTALSAILGLTAAAAAATGTHGIGWILGRPVMSAAVLIIGIVGAAYGTVAAYSLLPAAWRAWSTA